MAGYTRSSRGNYKCLFCENPKAYKTFTGIDAHLNKTHPNELLLARKDAEIERLKNRPPQIKEKVVYKAEPKKEYWNIPGYYCKTCQVAQRGGGIPRGQTVENTPHSECGMATLFLVREFK